MPNHIFRRLNPLPLACMAILGTLGPQASLSALAQVSGLEEVVVTAQRREQSIMEVPIAVTLVSGQALETFNLETSHDLQFLVPGITFAASSSTSQITLRGVGTGYWALGCPIASRYTPMNPMCRSKLGLTKCSMTWHLYKS